VNGLLGRGRPCRNGVPRELDLLVRGRQAVLDVLSRYGPLDFSALHARLRPPPGPERLADWLVSMVGDGSLHAMMDRDGRAAFALTQTRSAELVPTVIFDAAHGN